MTRAHELLSSPFAMESRAWAEFVCRTAALERSDPQAFFMLLERDSDDPELEVRDGVAVIPVNGPLMRRQSFFAGGSYPVIAALFKQAIARPDVRSVVFNVDSPGGDALGLAELSDLIFASRGAKPIDAVIRGLGASAAYCIASAASAVFGAREAIVGSIGTIMTLIDWSKFDENLGIQEINIVASQSPKKNPDPMTVEGRAQLQEEVDGIAEVFVRSVARNRGVRLETVLSSFGQGGVFVGDAAQRAGLVDGIATLDEVVAARAARRPVQFATPLAA